jgi:4-hydroxybenzoate polyprenyltransferase
MTAKAGNTPDTPGAAPRKPLLRTLLSLVRIPTVFSSMSNAYAGWFIAGGAGIRPALLLGIAAAALFIMAGMALNDVADAEVDARERPSRPIPSGAISRGGAWALSLVLMAAGLVLLRLANPLSLVVGVLLCLSIFAYNFLLKSTFLGPAAMGLCRLLNLLTGMSLAWTGLSDGLYLADSALWALISLWAYITLVTFLARDEVQGNARWKARLFLMGITAWFMAWSAALWLVLAPGRSLVAAAMALVWLAHVLFLMGPLRGLSRDPSPRNTGRTVGAMLRAVPFADVMAMLAAGTPLIAALPGLLWILPAWLAGRLFYST